MPIFYFTLFGRASGIRSRDTSRSVRLTTGNSSLVFIDPSALRRTTNANAAVAAAHEPHTMATTASSLARAFGIVLRQVCQLFNTVSELYNGLLHNNNSMNITYQEADQLHHLDQVFVKSELKVGVLYVKNGQTTEEQILANKDESPAFAEFLNILGEKVRLKGFDKYKGGLDTVHDLTGKESVYTRYRGIEIMFHVSTMLPHEENDPQKLQKKRHIGNDIVCVAFVESDNTLFWTGVTFYTHLLSYEQVQRIQVSASSSSPKPRKYKVSVVCRDEVSAFKPYLWHESVFESGPRFTKWLLAKIINGERASYSAPKFARMSDRTKTQMLEDIVNNLANHLATGQIPKPYRRGSWRPIGHMRPSSPLLDSVRYLFEGYDQLSKDFTGAFSMNAKMICDVVFNVIGGSSVFARNNPGHQNATLAALDPIAAAE